MTGAEQKTITMFFVVLACHLPILDGFDMHFQASVHFTLSSAINKSQWHWKIQEKFFGNAVNQTQGCWVSSKNYTSVLYSPPDYNYVWMRLDGLKTQRKNIWHYIELSILTINKVLKYEAAFSYT